MYICNQNICYNSPDMVKLKGISQKIFINKTSNWMLQLFRYVFVGGFSFIVDYGLLYICTEYGGIHYLLSATISFLAGLIVNYILSTKWIFTKSKISNTYQLPFIFQLAKKSHDDLSPLYPTGCSLAHLALIDLPVVRSK